MLVNGKSSKTISIEDRGLLYGDGLFETILCEKGEPVFFAEHMQRLKLGCRKLNFSDQDTELIQSEVQAVANNDNCVIKVILTRGKGARGYYYDSKDENSTRIICRSDLPTVSVKNWSEGIRLYLCKYRLAENKNLAGIKHLNRLDQVLARREWREEFAEGVMLNTAGQVVEGTMSNVFLLVRDQLFTPKLNLCGVQGVMRDFICQYAEALSIPCQQTEISLAELKAADAIFVCNSVIGIWPVIYFARRDYSVDSTVRDLMQHLHQNVCTLYKV